ncbi:MAG TPA: type II secretion system protein GspI [Gammaproteobacteria bacterium]|nr:type II secretion system protein GspI [Gammaproteobacteria bacterium]
MSSRPKHTSSGFTLLEVMVSILVLAIALGAVVTASTSYTTNLGHLRDMTLAHWVAVNKMNEITLTETWPKPGIIKGSLSMANRDWEWRIDVQNTPDQSVRRLEIEVRHNVDDEDALSTLIGFVGEP